MKRFLLALLVLAPAAVFAQTSPLGERNPLLGQWRVELIGQKDVYQWTVKDEGTIESKVKQSTTEMTYDIDADGKTITLESDDSKPMRLRFSVEEDTFTMWLFDIARSPAFEEYRESFGGAWDKLKGVNDITDEAVEHLKKQLGILLEGLPIMRGFREKKVY